ncbi:hypothetical protein RFI_02293, partial [Reticulomyxa filosa]
MRWDLSNRARVRPFKVAMWTGIFLVLVNGQYAKGISFLSYFLFLNKKCNIFIVFPFFLMLQNIITNGNGINTTKDESKAIKNKQKKNKTKIPKCKSRNNRNSNPCIDHVFHKYTKDLKIIFKSEQKKLGRITGFEHLRMFGRQTFSVFVILFWCGWCYLEETFTSTDKANLVKAIASSQNPSSHLFDDSLVTTYYGIEALQKAKDLSSTGDLCRALDKVTAENWEEYHALVLSKSRLPKCLEKVSDKMKTKVLTALSSDKLSHLYYALSIAEALSQQGKLNFCLSIGVSVAYGLCMLMTMSEGEGTQKKKKKNVSVTKNSDKFNWGEIDLVAVVKHLFSFRKADGLFVESATEKTTSAYRTALALLSLSK